MNLRRSGFESFRKDFLRVFILSILFSCLFIPQKLQAQTEYIISLSNGQKANQNTFEFDVLIKSTENDFELTSYQAAFSFNTEILNGGTASFTFVEGTSEITNIPSTAIGVNNTDGSIELTFASLPGSDIIPDQFIRVGRFRFESSNSFESNPFISWNFDGQITTILTGPAFSDITDPSSHISELSGLQKFNIAEAFASATTDINTAPEKTIDGLGYFDNDPNSRWAAKPLPQWISYDLGFEQEISMLRISFFNFHLDRIYQYSVSVSNDNNDWIEVAGNVSSLPEEWSIVEFSPVSARYVKIDIHSSTNNPENWANVWEAEIYGSSQTTEIEHEDVITKFELLQNYPNPFNPSTIIVFNLVEEARTTLSVYNIMGEKVTDLADDFYEAGRHEIVFNAGNLASGVYVYKLNVGDRFSEIKKMILVK